jgi:rhomboid protease GluP
MSDAVELRRWPKRADAEKGAAVLALANIRCRILPVHTEYGLFVPPTDFSRAHTQLLFYEEMGAFAERKLRIRRRTEELIGSALYSIILIAIFAAAHGDLLSVDWADKGASRSDEILRGELWRTITSLTVHVEFDHLFANLIFGLIAAHFVGRCFGVGSGWLLILVSGALGNIVSALIYGVGHSAIGASIALFGALGVLSGYSNASDTTRVRGGLRRWLPIIAGATLLILLGLGGQNTDVLGHISGFFSGVLIGFFVRFIPDEFRLTGHYQIQSGGAAICIIILSWFVALSI